MARKVEENVDPVAADLLGQLFVVQPTGISPDRRGGLKADRHLVFGDAVGVAHGFASAAVEVLQGPDQEVPDGVPAKIGGDEPDAKPAPGSRAFSCGRHPVRSGRGVQPVVLRVGRGEFGKGTWGQEKCRVNRKLLCTPGESGFNCKARR